MQTYTDIKGTSHVLKLTLAECFRVKKQTGIDLGATKDPAKLAALMERIQSDEMLLIQILAGIENTTVDELLSVFNCGTLETASTAFVYCLLDFLPQSESNKAMRTHIENTLKLRDQTTALMESATLAFMEQLQFDAQGMPIAPVPAES